MPEEFKVSHRSRKRVKEAKRKARPELKDKDAWIELNYINNFDKFWIFDDNLERINVNDVSREEFIEKYEKVYKPVVIEGLQVLDQTAFANFNNVNIKLM